MDKFKDLLKNIGGDVQDKKMTANEYKDEVVNKATSSVYKSIKKLLFAVCYIFAESYIILLLAGEAFKDAYTLNYLETICMILFVRLTIGSYKNK